jgi:UDP-N-acetylmuramyl pentapeptide phosphotransferase/UDP-N-acetylglucosamine-1-phosphate transferase
MNEKQLGLVIISPMVVGTAVLLWRQGAMRAKSVALVAIAVAAVSGFLFFNF